MGILPELESKIKKVIDFFKNNDYETNKIGVDNFLIDLIIHVADTLDENKLPQSLFVKACVELTNDEECINKIMEGESLVKSV